MEWSNSDQMNIGTKTHGQKSFFPKDPCWKPISLSLSSPKIHSQNNKIKDNPKISNTQKPKNSNKTQFISNNQQQNQPTWPTWLIESNKHTNPKKLSQFDSQQLQAQLIHNRSKLKSAIIDPTTPTDSTLWDKKKEVPLSLMLGLSESKTIEQSNFDKDEEVEDNNKEEDEQQALVIIIVVIDDKALCCYCWGVLPAFLSSTISRKVYCFLDLIFFFFLVSFFGFGYLIFGFDFLGLGICSGFDFFSNWFFGLCADDGYSWV